MSETPLPEDEFQDPLENYDPPSYDDPLEQALADETVATLQTTPYAAVTPATSVAEALKKLVGDQIACLLVEEDGKLVGVFSDRDVLDKVALEWDATKDRPVRDLMTSDPVYVYDTQPASAVLTVMAVSGYRHVPVVDVNRNVRGIVSPQRVTRFLREHFTSD